MLYIISGASRSGKSIAAKILTEENKTSYLPLDSIVMAFTNGVPEFGIHDKLWPHEIAEKIWPFLKAFCENIIWNNIDYLIEGEAFLPQLLSELQQQYSNTIKSCFIGYSFQSVEEKVNLVKKYPQPDNDWLNLEPDSFIYDHINNMIQYSNKIKTDCEKYNLAYFDTSAHFNETINEVVEYFKKI